LVPYTKTLDDIVFSIDHLADAHRIGDWETEESRGILEHFESFAQDVLAPTNSEGDQVGAQLENGVVRMPTGIKSAYRDLAAGGWQGLSAPEKFGGSGLSHVLSAAVSELFSGANLSMQMVCNLVPGAITTLLHHGSDAQRSAWIPKLADGTTLATMCLTEPGAGSDLSAVRTTARQGENGWTLSGEKIFISGGDQDMSEDILHLVLARSGAREEGVKGLSLFACPKQPAARVTRIEEKMGLHASPTCHMVFEEAEVELIGACGHGLTAMFTMMNHARLDVSLQGVALAARARDIAGIYAAERKQGRGSDGSAAVLSDHADVRRMLDTQRVLEISARAMCHIALVELELGNTQLANFLTPLCKVMGSEAGIRSADLGIQVLGGYGYLEEYGLSQVWRDARICAIYEGANGIHMRTLATRGLRPGGGSTEFETMIAALGGTSDTVQEQLADWRALREQILASDRPEALAHRLTEATGQVFTSAIWTRMMQVAENHPAPDDMARLARLVLSENAFPVRLT